MEKVHSLYSGLRFAAPLALILILVPATISLCATQENQRIPLCQGLTIVTAISQPEGDYESIKTIESIDAGIIRLKYSSERRVQNFGGSQPRLRKVTMYRNLLLGDLKTSTSYLQQFHERAPAKVPGTTAIGVSSAVLHALKSASRVELGIFNDLPPSPLSSNPKVHPSVYDYQMMGTVERVGNSPQMVPLTVNGAKVELPAVQARGDFLGEKAEFFFLDDESNPISLKFRIGIGEARPANAGAADPAGDRDTLEVVKISYHCGAVPVNGAGRPIAGGLEKALTRSGRVEVYDIYFSFNSDQIREESEPTLQEIAGLLRRHPDWKLNIEGHTDNIASDRFNLDLSRRRAGAVKNALVTRYSIDASRLATAGFGESRPKDTNDTLEGRARNRRVELVRQR